MSFSRRNFLKTAAGGTLASFGRSSLAADDPVLNISADPQSALYSIRDMAEQETGIRLNIVSGQYANRLQNAVFKSAPCQLFEFRSNNTRSLMRSEAIRPIETSRLSGWDELHQTLETLESFAEEGFIPTYGATPSAEVYFQGDETTGSARSELSTHMPIYFSNESFAYSPGSGPATEDESWQWILSNALSGRVALSNSPATVYYALALAAQGTSSIPPIADLANPTPEELEQLYEFTNQLADDGQFSNFWGNPSELVGRFRSGQVTLANLATRDIPVLREEGVDLAHASPREGFIGQSTALFLSSSTNGQQEELAYRFMDWLTNGRAGAEFSRYGYSSPYSESTRQFMTANTWQYFYAGMPATEEIYDPDGNLIAAIGDLRPGGSFEERFQRIGIWATEPNPQIERILHHWHHLLLKS